MYAYHFYTTCFSVKLAIWENCLSEYIESIAEVSEVSTGSLQVLYSPVLPVRYLHCFTIQNLKDGGELKLSREEVLKKTGELYALSHVINLSSHLLDTPDFYWDRDELEKLYRQSINYFNVHSRTRVCYVPHTAWL